MSKVLKINITKHVRCTDCGELLSRWPTADIAEIREHGERVYSFVCAPCGGEQA